MHRVLVEVQLTLVEDRRRVGVVPRLPLLWVQQLEPTRVAQHAGVEVHDRRTPLRARRAARACHALLDDLEQPLHLRRGEEVIDHRAAALDRVAPGRIVRPGLARAADVPPLRLRLQRAAHPLDHRHRLRVEVVHRPALIFLLLIAPRLLPSAGGRLWRQQQQQREQQQQQQGQGQGQGQRGRAAKRHQSGGGWVGGGGRQSPHQPTRS